jgi:glycosyltransferase involved in cell wall biosynthesis
MRLTCLSVSDQLGGSEVALVGMISTLERLRPEWQFHVVLPGDGPLRERVSETNAACSILPMPPSLARIGEWAAVEDGWSAVSQVTLGIRLCETAASLPAYQSRLDRVVAEFRPDVVHTNGLKAHVLGARLRSHPAHVVWHLHEYISRRRLTCWLLRRYVSQCSAVIANSASVAADVVSSIGSPPDVHIVPNSVDLDVFSPAGARLDLDRLAGLPTAPAGIVRVGLVATYARWKGHAVFLEAVRQAASRVPLRGYIIGGPLYDTSNSQFTPDQLQQMIDAAGLREKVGLTGFVDAASAMRALDIVVHASVEPEPFGLVIAEAMACGRALITTAHGGAAELVADGEDAVISPPKNVTALAHSIEKLATDAAMRMAIGARARDNAQLRFSPQTIGSRLAQVFETVVFGSRVAQPA